MLRMAICDQELNLVKKLKQWALAESDIQKQGVDCCCYRVGEELLWEMEDRGSFDLVFMELTGQKEIETAQQVIKQAPHCLIIFMAENKLLAYDAFRVHPFSFLLKPIRQNSFIEVLQTASERINRQGELYRFFSNRIYYQIPIDNILFFQSEKRIIRLICKGGEEILYYDTLTKVERKMEELSTCFIRIHHSYLVNMNHIKRYCYEEIEMLNGAILSISDQKKKLVKGKIVDCNIDVT